MYHFLDKIPGLLPEISTEINWFQNSLLLYNSLKLLQSSLSLFLMPAVGVHDNIFHVFFPPFYIKIYLNSITGIFLSQDNSIQLLGSMTDYLWTHVDNESHYDRDVVQRVGRSVFQGYSNTITITTSLKAENNDGSGLKVTTCTIAIYTYIQPSVTQFVTIWNKIWYATKMADSFHAARVPILLQSKRKLYNDLKQV